MAQAGDTQRTSNAQNGQQAQNKLRFKSSSKAQTSQTFQQLLQREGSKWSNISTQKLKKNNNKEDERNHRNKKSVLAKVKEKVKKLKHSLSRKKQRHDNDPPCTSVTCTPIDGPENKRGEGVEFHTARTPDSKHIPDTNKQSPIPIPEKRSVMSKDEHANSSNTITETQAKNRIPPDTSAVNADTDAKHQVPSVVAANTDTKDQTVATTDVPKEHPCSVPSAVAADTDTKDQTAATTDVPKEHGLPGSNSRFSNLTVSTSRKDETSIEEGDKMKGESQKRDKGVSVKEYLMQKFEPGEDERALSQIITQTISPRRDKVREAMSAFLKNEEPSTSKEVNSSDIDNDTNVNFKSKSLPASVNTNSKVASVVQSHSLGSNAAKNLNQTFKSTVVSYQNHLNSTATSSSPNKNPLSKDSSTHLHSPAKSSSSPLGHASSANETTAPAQTNNGESIVPSQSEINPIRTPLSMAIKAQLPGQTDANGTSNEGCSPVSNNANTSRVPSARNLLRAVEEENGGRILKAK